MTAPLVVILAGGEGRRIGGRKPLRRLGGERLIDRALRLARCWSDDVRLAVRSTEQAGEAGAPLLFDDPGIEGPLAGLSAALRATRAGHREVLLTLPCDAPFLPADLAPRLSKAIGEGLAALGASGDDLHPTCALWRAAAFEHLPAYLVSGRRSLIGFAEALGHARAQWPADVFLNVNTPAQLRLAEARLASEIEYGDERSAG